MSSHDPDTIGGQHGVDPESPWLGLRPFTEETQSYFFGRGDELQDFFERVLHKPLCVLFGRSGLGKTSLIQAGLVPRLRESGFLPITIRINYDSEAGSVGSQVVESLLKALESVGRSNVASADLWLLLHDPIYGLVDADGSAAVRPIFIFDQFEEIFTLGAQRRHTADEFREMLSALIENRMPAKVREQIAADDELADRINYRAQPAKVLLSLREDFLYLLERWRWEMPSLMENRLELRPLNGGQAVRAIIEPANMRSGKPAIVTPEIARSIVSFVAGAKPDVPLDEIDVVPPLLSLVCAELNARRLASGEEVITAAQLQGKSDDILERFYSSAFAEHPPAIREFVEERLISEAGYRQAVTLDTAEAELMRAGVSKDGVAAAMNELIERRLLVADERNRVRRIELTHDVLTSVALASRMARHEREASSRLTAEQRKRWRRQRRIAAISVIALVIGCAGLLLFAYRAQQKIKYRDLLDSAYLLFQAGDFSRSLVQFKEAARRQPSELEPWFGVGDSLVRQSYTSGAAQKAPLLSEAITAYNHTIEIEKKSDTADYSVGRARLAQAYVGLGDVYAVAEKPDFEKAEALYKQAKEIDPMSPDPPIGYGNVYLGQGKFHLAVEQYKTAIDLAIKRNTPSYGAHAGLGSAWFALGDYRKAIDEFNRAIGANPASVIARFRLANALYFNDNNDPAAAELFHGLIGSSMKRVDSLAQSNLALMLLEKTPAGSEASVLPEAIKYFDEAYQEDRYAFSALRLGMGRALQGDPKEAARLWNECGQLSWGSDAIERQLYSSFLSALRGEPEGSPALNQSIEFLEGEGAAGLLEGLRRDAELVRRSKLYDAQIVPILDRLDAAIRNARASAPPDSH